MWLNYHWEISFWTWHMLQARFKSAWETPLVKVQHFIPLRWCSHGTILLNIMSVFTLEIKTNPTNNFSMQSVPGWAALWFSGKQTYHIKLSWACQSVLSAGWSTIHGDGFTRIPDEEDVGRASSCEPSGLAKHRWPAKPDVQSSKNSY